MRGINNSFYHSYLDNYERHVDVLHEGIRPMYSWANITNAQIFGWIYD